MGDDWKSAARRQRIIQQIDEYVRQAPEGNSMKNAQEIESSLFQKASKEEEYLQYVTKIIKYFKDQAQSTNQNNSNLNAMLGAQQGPSVRPAGIGQGVTSGGQMIHINQNQMTNQTQMVHTGNAGTQISHSNTSGGQLGHTGVTGNQGVGPAGMMQGSMGAGGSRMPQMMGGNMTNQEAINWSSQTKARQQQNEMIMINNAKHTGMANISQMNSQVGKMGTLPISIPGQNEQVNQISVGGQIGRQGMTMQPRVPSPSFSVGGPVPHSRQGPHIPTSASPVLQQQPQQQQLPQHQQQQQQQQHNVSHSSLTFISSSPSSNAVPSPVNNPGGNRGLNQLGVPSPSGMISTPGQPQQQQPSPAPSGGSLEDRAYMEKVKQLQSKFLEPLRDIVQRLDNTDVEKVRKVRNLLEVIENPHRRATKCGMETLKACEVVLERIGIQQREPRSETTAASKPPTKDNPGTILFDAVNFALKSPVGYHTIHRTLSPALKTLLGPDFEPRLPKKIKLEELVTHTTDTPLINDIVQGEVARLPPRFKINLESQQLSGSDDLTLSCQLDDPNLPCVPPITLIIPPSYPSVPPRCRLSVVEYETTTFLRKIREIMTNRQFHLPEVCSLTMILDAWEMSVRRACSSKPFVPDAINPLVNLNIFS